MSTIAIRADGLSKVYRLGARTARYGSLRDSASRFASDVTKRGLSLARGRRQAPASDDRTIHALRDVSFEVPQGEVVGLIGQNGAGKSTLLKVLSRITEPTHGFAEISGRVGSLLEVGTGFHPELTGHENILLCGAILGMRRSEIIESFDDIVAFAGVERFIDTAVKHYSSGMYLRLAFAVAAHLRPEVLLVDEVLAVGDVGFQKRCLGKMSDVARQGRTVLFVSHNLVAVENLCARTMLIRDGHVDTFADSRTAIERYLRHTSAGADSLPETLIGDRPDRQGSGAARLIKVMLLDAAGSPRAHVRAGEAAGIRLCITASPALHMRTECAVEIRLHDQSGTLVTTLSTYLMAHLVRLHGLHDITCLIDEVMLAPGVYSASTVCFVNGIVADAVANAFAIEVVGGDVYGSGRMPKRHLHGCAVLRHSWESAAESTLP